MSEVVTTGGDHSPIYWERYGDQCAKVVDLRMLPDDVKVAILHAAIQAVAHWGEGDIEAPELSDAEATMEALVAAVGQVQLHMHPTLLVPRWEPGQ